MTSCYHHILNTNRVDGHSLRTACPAAACGWKDAPDPTRGALLDLATGLALSMDLPFIPISHSRYLSPPLCMRHYLPPGGRKGRIMPQRDGRITNHSLLPPHRCTACAPLHRHLHPAPGRCCTPAAHHLTRALLTLSPRLLCTAAAYPLHSPHHPHYPATARYDASTIFALQHTRISRTATPIPSLTAREMTRAPPPPTSLLASRIHHRRRRAWHLHAPQGTRCAGGMDDRQRQGKRLAGVAEDLPVPTSRWTVRTRTPACAPASYRQQARRRRWLTAVSAGAVPRWAAAAGVWI